MRKIPTIYKRDPENPRYVLPELVEGCEWVLAGEGIATRKYDGTCVMFDGTIWWARREVKAGKLPPENFRCIQLDENTGHQVGWEPIEQSPFVKFHTEALINRWGMGDEQARAYGVEPDWAEGTYELCGPKINGNPEGYEIHRLIAHANAQVLPLLSAEYDRLAEWFRQTTEHGWEAAKYEGVVWHHPDGRMAKIKRRDFPS
jgi:hypothetical protein